MAESVLEEAIKREPDRVDLNNHLATVHAERRAARDSGGQDATVSWAFVGLHMAIAWALFVVLLVATLLFPVYAMEAFAPALFSSAGAFGAGEIATTIALVLAWVVGAAVLVVRGFCFVWFWYLGLLPEVALAADATLPSAIRTSTFGARYTLSRKLFFAKRYGGARSHHAPHL